MIRALLVVVLVLGVVASPAWAEEPPSDPATLDALLRSEDPLQVSWGAHLAGREGVRDTIPALRAFLRPNPDRTSDEWMIAYRQVLDALIRLEAKVPAELLGENLPKAYAKTSMALILLARDPVGNQAALLERYDEAARAPKTLGITALTAGNVLATEKAPGFAARILPLITMNLVLHVYDTDDIRLGGGHSDLFSGRGDAIRRQPEGYPPYPFYRLVQEADPDLPLVADGVHPVRYRRTERTGTRFGFGGPVYRCYGSKLARGWVATMLGMKVEELALPERASDYHRWVSPEVYTAWATAKRDALLARHAEVVEALRKKSALTKEEAKAIQPRLTIEIDDQRENDEPPLPPVEHEASVDHP